MMSLAARLLPPWPLLALAASVAMLAGAFAFQYLGDMQPCVLCLRQRDVYWGAIAIAVLGFAATRFHPSIALKRAIAVLLGLAFVTGAIVALWHVAVEQKWVTFQCDVAPGRIPRFDPNASFEAPKCDEIQWSMFGVSMAGWNALVSVLLAGASFIVAASPRPQTDGEDS